MTAADLDKALKTAESAKGDTACLRQGDHQLCLVLCVQSGCGGPAKVQNGTRLDVAIKDSDRVLSCTVVSGADTKPGHANGSGAPV